MIPFPAAHALLTEAIRDHTFPGASYGVLLRGKVHAVESLGRFTYAPADSLVLPDTIYDMASVSKVMATTTMAMLLWERGQLALDQPIADRLPRFVHDATGDSPRRRITARMLLAHSSGLPAYERLYERCYTRDALLDACLQMPLENPPGTRTVYSDIGFILLGHLLETIAEERLDRYCVREIFGPLGMESTIYCPPAELKPSIPPTALDDAFRHRVLQGEVHDSNCYVLGCVSGHAGIFSNVTDTLHFANCILRGGAPLFRPQAVSLFTAPAPAESGPARALGWDLPSEPSSSGHFFSTRSVGHLGYTGTSLWIDVEKELAVVLLTNRTFPGNGPQGILNKIQEVRPRFHDAILGELGFHSRS